MAAFVGMPILDCTKNGTIDLNTGALTAELGAYPIFTLLFIYASIASVTIIVIFLEAAYFIATRVPRSSVANHRLNTVIMMSAYPMLVVFCLPAVLIPSSTPFCLAMGDLYYAFVMFKFVVIQVDYYGGHRKMMARLAAQKVMFNINSPILCCFFCFKPVRLTRRTFTIIKMLVLQVAIIRPILAFIQAIAGYAELSLQGTPIIVILCISIPSTLTGITSINMLTMATSSKDLAKFDLHAKAQLVLAGMLITGLQPTLLQIGNRFRPLGCILPFPNHLLSQQWQAFLIILESTLLMIPVLRYYRTGDGNVVGVPPPIEDDEEEPNTQIGKMRQWVRRHTLM